MKTKLSENFEIELQEDGTYYLTIKTCSQETIEQLDDIIKFNFFSVWHVEDMIKNNYNEYIENLIYLSTCDDDYKLQCGSEDIYEYEFDWRIGYNEVSGWKPTEEEIMENDKRVFEQGLTEALLCYYLDYEY